MRLKAGRAFTETSDLNLGLDQVTFLVSGLTSGSKSGSVWDRFMFYPECSDRRRPCRSVWAPPRSLWENKFDCSDDLWRRKREKILYLCTIKFSQCHIVRVNWNRFCFSGLWDLKKESSYLGCNTRRRWLKTAAGGRLWKSAEVWKSGSLVLCEKPQRRTEERKS